MAGFAAVARYVVSRRRSGRSVGFAANPFYRHPQHRFHEKKGRFEGTARQEENGERRVLVSGRGANIRDRRRCGSEFRPLVDAAHHTGLRPVGQTLTVPTLTQVLCATDQACLCNIMYYRCLLAYNEFSIMN